MSETRTIATNGIAVATHRLRALHEENVSALAQSMADQGQLQPIVVRPRKDGGYWLVAGLHRFEAAKKLKWKEIRCSFFAAPSLIARYNYYRALYLQQMT